MKGVLKRVHFPLLFSTVLLSCSQLSAGWFSSSKPALDPRLSSEESAIFDSSDKVFRRSSCVVRELRPAYHSYLYEAEILEDCFEGLFKLDATGKVLPGVAKSWEVLDRGLKFRFFLRKDAHHSDGQRVTAHDFISNLHRCSQDLFSSLSFREQFESTYIFELGIKNARDILAKKCPIESIGIRAVDDFTLEMELEKPVHTQLVLLTLAQPGIFVPMRLEYYQAMQDLSGVDPKASLPSNGAFCIYKVAYDEKIELKKNPHYWDRSAVKLEGVRYVLTGTSPADQAARWCNGELDYLWGKPDIKSEVSKTEPNCSWHSIQARGCHYLSYRQYSSLSNDRELRDIFAMILDRDRIKKIMESSEATIYGMLSPHYGRVQPAKPKWSEEKLASRLQKASERLRAKGYSAQDPLTIRLIHYLPPSQQTPFANYMASLSEQIPELNIVVKVETSTTVVNMCLDPEEKGYDLALRSKAHSAPRLLNLFKMVQGERPHQSCHCKKLQNMLPEMSMQIARLGQQLKLNAKLKQSFVQLEQCLDSGRFACFPWCADYQGDEAFTKLFYMESAAVKKAIYAAQAKLYRAFEKANDESCVLDEYDLLVRHLGSDSDLSDQDQRKLQTRLDEIILREAPVISLGTLPVYSTQSARVKALVPRRRDPIGRFPSSAVELKSKPSK